MITLLIKHWVIVISPNPIQSNPWMDPIHVQLCWHPVFRCRENCTARLDHVVVHLFIVMATIVSVIGITALVLIRLDIICGRWAAER